MSKRTLPPLERSGQRGRIDTGTEVEAKAEPADLPETAQQLKDADRILASNGTSAQNLKKLLAHRCWTAFWELHSQRPETHVAIDSEAGAKALLELVGRKVPGSAILPLAIDCLLDDTFTPVAADHLVDAVNSSPGFFRKFAFLCLARQQDISAPVARIAAALVGVSDLDLDVGLSVPQGPAVDAYRAIISSLPPCARLSLSPTWVVHSGCAPQLAATPHLNQIKTLQLVLHVNCLAPAGAIAVLAKQLLTLCSGLTALQLRSPVMADAAVCPFLQHALEGRANLTGLKIEGLGSTNLLAHIREFGPQVSVLDMDPEPGTPAAIGEFTQGCVSLLPQLAQLDVNYPLDMEVLSTALENQKRLQSLSCIAVFAWGEQAAFPRRVDEAVRDFSQNRYLTHVNVYHEDSDAWPAGTIDANSWTHPDDDDITRFEVVGRRNRTQFTSGGFAIGAGEGFAMSTFHLPTTTTTTTLTSDVGAVIGGFLDRDSQLNLSSVTKGARARALERAAAFHSDMLRLNTPLEDIPREAVAYVRETRLKWNDATTIPSNFKVALVDVLEQLDDSMPLAIEWFNALPALKESGLDSETIGKVTDDLGAGEAWGITRGGAATIMHEAGYPLEQSVEASTKLWNASFWKSVDMNSLDVKAVEAFCFVVATGHEWPDKSVIQNLCASPEHRNWLASRVSQDMRHLSVRYFMALPALRRSGLHEALFNHIYVETATSGQILPARHARMLGRLESAFDWQWTMLVQVRDTLEIAGCADVLRRLKWPLGHRSMFIAAGNRFYAPPEPRPPNWLTERAGDARGFAIVLQHNACPAEANLARFVRGDIGQRYYLPQLLHDHPGRTRFLKALLPLRKGGLPVEDIANAVAMLYRAGKVTDDELEEALLPLDRADAHKVYMRLVQRT
ncbi:MAG: hypothetical protein V4787_00955 [Pseudomonadota bacterium]